jgi:hypothetical protein
LLTALAGSALVPVVQAMATKFGEDVYAKIRHLLPGCREGQPDDERPIVPADPKAATVLEIPPRVSDKDTYAGRPERGCSKYSA